MSPIDFFSHADGAEDFVYLLQEPLFNYGSEILLELFRSAMPSSHRQRKRQLPTYDEATRSSITTDDVHSENTEHTITPQQQGKQLPQVHPTLSTLASPIYKTPKRPSASSGNDDEAHLRSHVQSLRKNLSSDPSILPWSSIAGLSHAKDALEEFAAAFFHFPHLIESLRHQSLTGVLLFGPQGTGKTLLVKSFAAKYNFAFYDVRASAIMSKYLGDSERFISAMFTEIKENAPAVLLLDECDGLLCNPRGMDASGGQSYRLLQNELKNQWSDLIYSKSKVVVVGATNKPHDIDMDGFGRRLSLKLHIDLPTAPACANILEESLSRVRNAVRSEELALLGELCASRGLSGFDIDCALESLVRKGLRHILASNHFKYAMWQDEEVVIPCAAEDVDSLECSWKTFPCQEKLSYTPLDFNVLSQALGSARPTVDAEMVARHAAFANLQCTHDVEDQD